jgi:hypothetical protein
MFTWGDTLGQHFEMLMSLLGGLHRGMQCNVEFRYQLSICSRTEKNHAKRWPVAGPSGYIDLLTSGYIDLPTIVGTGSGTPEVPELPSARGYGWTTLSPGVINTEIWSSRLGVGRGTNNPTQ